MRLLFSGEELGKLKATLNAEGCVVAPEDISLYYHD